MKWKNTETGDTKEIVFFALFPRLCEDGYWRWLERLRVVKQYESGWDGSSWTRSYYSVEKTK